AVMQMVGPAFMDYSLNGRIAGPLGNRHPLAAAAPHGVFPCAGEDRWISIAVEADPQWRALVEAMGSPQWAQKPEYQTQPERVAHIEVLHEHLAEWTQGHDDRSLAHTLQAAGVPAAPVLNIADLLSDPHYQYRETFIEVDHPLGYPETIYGAYVKLSRTPAQVSPGPWIGQDNDRIFKEWLQMDEERYAHLKEAQVIY
ncbi:CoA transferase, partial [Myxococcota bacterium]|nr:CoA transferase [Myxococcota bacterium]